jgi:hypothetical protein
MITTYEFTTFLKHPALFWYLKNAPEKLPKENLTSKSEYEKKIVFRNEAVKLFGINPSVIPAQAGIQNTGLEENGFLYPGEFQSKEFQCKVDLVKKNTDSLFSDGLTLVNFKATLSPDNERYINELTYATIIIEELGYKVDETQIVYIDKDYVRGDTLDIAGLCKTKIATTEVFDNVKRIKEQMSECLKLVSAGKNSPSLGEGVAPIGDGVVNTSIVDLDYSKCTKGGFRELRSLKEFLDPPKEGGVNQLISLRQFQLEYLEQAKIEWIKDIDLKSAPVTFYEKQINQILANKSNEITFGKSKIEQFLNSMTYPIYFLDYETYQASVPPFKGQSSFQQVPFQYSLHRLDSPEAELQHTGYLHSESSDPTLELGKQLIAEVGETGSVLVWNEKFEKGCNTLIGRLHPELKTGMSQLNQRIIDLIIPFKNDWYIDKAFHGSCSIKKVLPVIDPSFSYSELAIGDGLSAQKDWMDIVLYGKNPEKKQWLLDSLTEYCGQDTLAEVVILKFLFRLLE